MHSLERKLSANVVPSFIQEMRRKDPKQAALVSKHALVAQLALCCCLQGLTQNTLFLEMLIQRSGALSFKVVLSLMFRSVLLRTHVNTATGVD